eukprot:TRINITY_DN15259_c0_g1_i4.p1 TRINITY_DN15259_c0_g1~~TRINITY_DN15259_c0_g1_i4.p1  ORF type:complete len:291 (-),score=31.59 TRINITY_DN15259_c0_g1_i4:93-965(-)
MCIRDRSIHTQSDFCINPDKYRRPEFDQKITLASLTFAGKLFRIYVFKSNDFVSDMLRRGSIYEIHNINAMQAYLNQYTSHHKITDSSTRVIFDIGANLGLYTIIFGLMGYRIVSFEPMEENIYMLRKSLCLNPSVNAVLLPYAVGKEEALCKLYTHSANYLDGIVVCNNYVLNGYILKGSFPVVRIDPYAELFSNITVIKMDIEGGEHEALKGGRKLFLELKVPYIQSEITQSTIAARGGNVSELFIDFHRAGYKIYRDVSMRTMLNVCLLYTSPSPRDLSTSRMPSSA